ncbi:hypothetical protein NS365_05555 [Aureimonas ureilytica]|uniref:Uncharacterized protein n=2 Tax=Aureimonas ureilytica TaxID=401562 RepID=A0A175RT35_9HYPH|nr:hypothetical protein NS365_05555 [Aureimonas ureilytica]
METDMIRMLTAAAVAILAATPALAGKVDVPADGTYSQQCLPTVTCFLSIERKGRDAWKLEAWADETKPGGRRLCEHTAMLKVGVGEFASGDEFDALVGKTKGVEFAISGNADGSLMPIVTGACANAKLQKGRGMIGFGGSFYPEGDL